MTYKISYDHLKHHLKNLSETTNTFILNTKNFVILHFKSSIIILILIIVNKPLIVLLINIILSILIRGMFIDVIHADDLKSLVQQSPNQDPETKPPHLQSIKAYEAWVQSTELPPFSEPLLQNLYTRIRIYKFCSTIFSLR